MAKSNTRTPKLRAKSAAEPGTNTTPPAPSFPSIVKSTLSDQLDKMGEAMSILPMCRETILSVYECGTNGNPSIDLALDAAWRMLDDVYGAFQELQEAAGLAEVTPRPGPPQCSHQRSRLYPT